MRPPAEATLRDALRTGYGLEIETLDVEADGADSGAWAWRATTSDGRALFVKLRQELRPAAILVPRFLADSGFDEVVAARPTVDGAAWLDIEGCTVVVMDRVDGRTGFRGGLTRDQWRALGAFSARLHAVELPPDLRAIVRVEDFRSDWPDHARRINERIRALDKDGLDEVGTAVRRRWLDGWPTIARFSELVDVLGRRIRERPLSPPMRLCHADFHAANVLIDSTGGLHVVDWDELVLAPPERDWMFVRGSVVAGTVADREADAFEAGYGPPASAPDLELLAWYRIDWALQDVAGFAEEVALEPDRRAETRPRAARIFEALFGPGDEVHGALAIADRLGV